mgnify:CR=1 FL=1
MNTFQNSWDLIAWDKVHLHILKFQKKIYCAALLKEKGRVYSLQKKLINSRILRLWVAHELMIRTNQASKSTDQYWLFSQLKCLNRLDTSVEDRYKGNISKGRNLLVQTVFQPEWDAIFDHSNAGFKHYRSVIEVLEKISWVFSKYKSCYILNINLNRYIHLIDHDIIQKQIKNSLLLKSLYLRIVKINNLISSRSSILRTYLYSDKDPEIQLYNLLIDIIFGQFSMILRKYIKHKYMYTKVLPGNSKEKDSTTYLRYLYNFTFIHTQCEYLKDIRYIFRYWLNQIGIRLDLHEMKIHLQGHKFSILDFSCNYIPYTASFQIRPKVSAQNYLLKTISLLNQKLKNSAFDIYINRLTIILKHWSKYFRICNCRKTLGILDEKIFQKIKSWAFRRHPRWSREKIKSKYFPTDITIKYYNRIYSGNWILLDSTKSIFLNKLRWDYRITGTNMFDSANKKRYYTSYLYSTNMMNRKLG